LFCKVGYIGANTGTSFKKNFQKFGMKVFVFKVNVLKTNEGKVVELNVVIKTFLKKVKAVRNDGF
jgi:hypothetical protein